MQEEPETSDNSIFSDGEDMCVCGGGEWVGVYTLFPVIIINRKLLTCTFLYFFDLRR